VEGKWLRGILYKTGHKEAHTRGGAECASHEEPDKAQDDPAKGQVPARDHHRAKA
jgi:hypothetical protein